MGHRFLTTQSLRAYLIDGPSWVNNHAHVLRALTGVTSNRFLKYALDQLDYSQLVNGTTRLKLTKGAMAGIRLALPPRCEQERIVAAIEEQFSRIDVGVATLHRVQRSVERMRAATLISATTQEYLAVPFGDVLRETLRNGHSAKADAQGSIPVLTLTAVTLGDFSRRNMKMTAADPSEGPRLMDSAGRPVY